MDTFNKEYIQKKFSDKINELEINGLKNNIRILEKFNGSKTQIMGKKILNFNSNNFLGFSEDPKIINASQRALEKYGVGPGAVRSISGSFLLHQEFEKELAKFKGVEDCVVVQSGFVANTALLPILVGPEDCVISDELNHASIIDGIRLSKVNKMIYKHSNMEDLENKVQVAKSKFPDGMVVIITDGVFSMDGEICNLPKIVEIAHKYGAFTYVDDAWGEFGLGKTGRGTPEHFDPVINPPCTPKPFDSVPTSKSIWCWRLKCSGVQGGFITGSKSLIDYIRQRSRPFIFSTGLGIAECGAGLAVLKELNQSTKRIEVLHKRTKYFADGLKKIGFDVTSKTQIIPLMINDEKKTQAMSQLLYENGVFVTPIVFPTVPRGTARCRFIVSSNHTIEDLNACLEIINKCAKQLKILN